MRTYKYQVSRTGPGSGSGAKFYSLTEALAYARHVLKEGASVVIEPI